uniref:PTS-dependent dihydroxyacetone kinase phosphotransferase subunit DhaM n=1 Tax=Desertifilum tharense IPPAS B-1220 TaxID=1781255 RepID=A0ACD5GQF1_9CYAN
MVGILIVSHSRKLAQGIQELVSQMIQGTVPIAIAAGMDDPQRPLGTDPLQIQQAIEALDCEDGVLVLMDLGSAVLSAEMALEFLPPEQPRPGETVRRTPCRRRDRRRSQGSDGRQSRPSVSRSLPRTQCQTNPSVL